jgi:hypothetical protein
MTPQDRQEGWRPSRTSPRRPRLLKPVGHRTSPKKRSHKGALEKFEALLKLASSDRNQQKPNLDRIGTLADERIDNAIRQAYSSLDANDVEGAQYWTSEAEILPDATSLMPNGTRRQLAKLNQEGTLLLGPLRSTLENRKFELAVETLEEYRLLCLHAISTAQSATYGSIAHSPRGAASKFSLRLELCKNPRALMSAMARWQGNQDIQAAWELILARRGPMQARTLLQRAKESFEWAGGEFSWQQLLAKVVLEFVAPRSRSMQVVRRMEVDTSAFIPLVDDLLQCAQGVMRLSLSTEDECGGAAFIAADIQYSYLSDLLDHSYQLSSLQLVDVGLDDACVEVLSAVLAKHPTITAVDLSQNALGKRSCITVLSLIIQPRNMPNCVSLLRLNRACWRLQHRFCTHAELRHQIPLSEPKRDRCERYVDHRVR